MPLFYFVYDNINMDDATVLITRSPTDTGPMSILTTGRIWDYESNTGLIPDENSIRSFKEFMFLSQFNRYQFDIYLEANEKYLDFFYYLLIQNISTS